MSGPTSYAIFKNSANFRSLWHENRAFDPGAQFSRLRGFVHGVRFSPLSAIFVGETPRLAGEWRRTREEGRARKAPLWKLEGLRGKTYLGTVVSAEILGEQYRPRQHGGHLCEAVAVNDTGTRSDRLWLLPVAHCNPSPYTPL